jgi:hypothetical protein
MSTPIIQTLDADGRAELLAQDFAIDAPLTIHDGGEDPANTFAKGDAVQRKRCRGKRVTGYVVKQTSPDRCDVFWPHVQIVQSTRARVLKKVTAEAVR